MPRNAEADAGALGLAVDARSATAGAARGDSNAGGGGGGAAVGGGGVDAAALDDVGIPAVVNSTSGFTTMIGTSSVDAGRVSALGASARGVSAGGTSARDTSARAATVSIAVSASGAVTATPGSITIDTGVDTSDRVAAVCSCGATPTSAIRSAGLATTSASMMTGSAVAARGARASTAGAAARFSAGADAAVAGAGRGRFVVTSLGVGGFVDAPVFVGVAAFVAAAFVEDASVVRGAGLCDFVVARGARGVAGFARFDAVVLPAPPAVPRVAAVRGARVRFGVGVALAAASSTSPRTAADSAALVASGVTGSCGSVNCFACAATSAACGCFAADFVAVRVREADAACASDASDGDVEDELSGGRLSDCFTLAIAHAVNRARR